MKRGKRYLEAAKAIDRANAYDPKGCVTGKKGSSCEI